MLLRPAMILLFLSVSAPLAFAQDDVLDKIRLLELQIQELKALKQQQAVTEIKLDHCMKAVAQKKFCTCVSEKLPLEVGFEQYVHTMITSRDKLGYGDMTPEQKKVVDATIEVRDKCIEKGFFK